jgi:adenylate cyclase
MGNKLPLAFEDLGEQAVKNIAQPIRPHRVRTGALAPQPAGALLLPDKPSIAVLPSRNMSSDPEQEYFADGMVEEIITALSDTTFDGKAVLSADDDVRKRPA